MVTRPKRNIAASGIISVPITFIDSNPYRNLPEYPWIDSKLDTLQKSIKDVGFWEGVHARSVGNRYQLAFGHHRIEAARRLAIQQVPLIVKPYTDEQMLQLMARENGDDYRTYFSVLLNTWESAYRFVTENLSNDDRKGSENVTIAGIARLAGWMALDGKPLPLAYHCNEAMHLIAKGYLDRKDLQGISPGQAGKLVSRASKLADDPSNAPDKMIRAMNSALNGLRYGDYTIEDSVQAFSKVMASKMSDPSGGQEELERDREIGPGRNKKKSNKPVSFSGRLKLLNDKLRALMRNDALEKLVIQVTAQMKAISWDDDIAAIQECAGHLDRLAATFTQYKELVLRNDLQGNGQNNPDPVVVKDVKEPKSRRSKKPIEVVVE